MGTLAGTATLVGQHWVNATFPPATALPALPSKPDFNSNVSSGVINKPCNSLLQRAGTPAASATPALPASQGRGGF